MLEVYWWMWAALVGALAFFSFGAVAAASCLLHASKLLRRQARTNSLARALLAACRDHWDTGGTMVFRGRDGKERTLKRC